MSSSGTNNAFIEYLILAVEPPLYSKEEGQKSGIGNTKGKVYCPGSHLPFKNE